jgi:hypothetical protein
MCHEVFVLDFSLKKSRETGYLACARSIKTVATPDAKQRLKHRETLQPRSQPSEGVELESFAEGTKH